MGAEEATQIVLAALGAQTGLVVHQLGPGRISVARTRRPPWAVVLCVATVWLAGLGLLFLLVKRTESGELIVNDGPRGCVVTVPPLVDLPTTRALEEALRAGRAATGAFRPAGDDLDSRTVARRDIAPPGGEDGRIATVNLRFEAGSVTVGAGHPVVLGRDPSPTGPAEARTVPGDATTVSKSHLLVDFDGVSVAVEDLGSTNGSSVICDGMVQAIVPGTRVVVAEGERVAMGAVTFVVERSEPRS